MNLVPINLESIRIGLPLPFPLVDKAGVLLAKKGFVVPSKEVLEDFSERGDGIYLEAADAEALQRAYKDQLEAMVRDDRSLGMIADVKLSTGAIRPRAVADNERVDWPDLQEQASFLLRDTNPTSFQERLERIHDTLNRESRRNADRTLFALIYLSASETQKYSATHAMLVSVMCALASREVLNWPEPVEALLCKAALTMNVGMTDLQDKLAVQVAAPTPQQRISIDGHAKKSAAILQLLGIADPALLEAVREHHTQSPGPLRSKTPAHRLARLIQRADMFAARLAPRATRTPIAPAAAMQACYFDENRQVDEAGAALIKAVGIYQPGSFVKLATDEVAIVIKRGINTTTPQVAVLINRSGLPTVEPTIRDTNQREYRIVASVAHRDVRVKINLERMLLLTTSTASDRPW
jgi:HD-GYP domain-containing protein (c-di-GMP phosphodiesterase class II)